MASVFDVANWFLSKEPMSPKKLQKLLYYYQAWGYALLKKNLIDDSAFEAWVHGPVSPELYQQYKEFGWKDIPQYGGELYPFSEKENSLLESVYYTYGDKSANELEALTHIEKPWINARLGYDEYENCNTTSSPTDMEEYYFHIYAGNQGD